MIPTINGKKAIMIDGQNLIPARGRMTGGTIRRIAEPGMGRQVG